MNSEEVRLRNIGSMTVQECIQELAKEPNIDQLRALVKVRRYLKDMGERCMTGKAEVDVQRGVVRRVWRPEYEDV